MMAQDNDTGRTGVSDDKSWMLTASGKKLFFLLPTVEDICPADIAIHTSQLCRFTGATNQFYPVSQHGVFVAKIIKTMLDKEGVDFESAEYWDQILAGLLHDAEEYATNDLSSPLKSCIRGKYRWIGAGILRKIFEKFGVDWLYYNKTVKSADNIALMVEHYYLMPDHPDWPKVSKSEMIYARPKEMTSKESAKEWLDTLRHVIRKRDKFRVDETQPEAV